MNSTCCQGLSFQMFLCIRGCARAVIWLQAVYIYIYISEPPVSAVCAVVRTPVCACAPPWCVLHNDPDGSQRLRYFCWKIHVTLLDHGDCAIFAGKYTLPSWITTSALFVTIMDHSVCAICAGKYTLLCWITATALFLLRNTHYSDGSRRFLLEITAIALFLLKIHVTLRDHSDCAILARKCTLP